MASSGMTERLQGLRSKNHSAFELAVLLSGAVRVEQSLIRRLRLRFLPASDPSAEADLWFSPLVRAKSTLGITLHPEVLPALRAMLAVRPDREEIRSVIAEAHAALPALLLLEERLVWLGIAGAPESAINAELGRVVKAMVSTTSRCESLSAWCVRALPQLPLAVRQTAGAWVLRNAAQTRVQVAIPLDCDPPSTLPDVSIPSLLPDTSHDAVVRVRRAGEDIIIDTNPSAAGFSIRIPGTDPLFLVVEHNGIRDLVTIPRGTCHSLRVESPGVELRCLRGSHWHLGPRPAAVRPPAEPHKSISEPSFRVLLIGIDDYRETRLEGCVNDIDAIQRVLIRRFGVPPERILRLASPVPDSIHETTVREMPATLANIREAFAQLAESTQSGDRVFIHYSGHSRRIKVTDPSGLTFIREALMPVDFDAESPPRSLFDFELNELLGRITSRTRSVTVMLDCDGIAAIRRDDCLIISASLPFEVPQENSLSGGVRMGVFTRAFATTVEALSSSDAIRSVSWSDFWHTMCDEVRRVNPAQHPWMTGNPPHTMFGSVPVARDLGIPVRRGAHGYELAAGTLASIDAGAELVIYGEQPAFFPELGSAEDLAARLGVIRVTQAERARALAPPVGAEFELPSGARGRIVKAAHAQRLRCAVGSSGAEIVRALERSQLLEVVEPGWSAAIKVLETGRRWLLYVDHGPAENRPQDALLELAPAFQSVLDSIEHCYRYMVPLHMAEQTTDLPGGLMLDVLLCSRGVPPELAQGPDLPLAPSDREGVYHLERGSQACIRVHNRSAHRLRVALLWLTGRGQVRHLGDPVIEVGCMHVFWAANVLGEPFMIPPGGGATRAIERFIAIGTTDMDSDLRYLCMDRVLYYAPAADDPVEGLEIKSRRDAATYDAAIRAPSTAGDDLTRAGSSATAASDRESHESVAGIPASTTARVARQSSTEQPVAKQESPRSSSLRDIDDGHESPPVQHWTSAQAIVRTNGPPVIPVPPRRSR